MQLVKIGELARLSGVPIATIKHYLREGLITASRKTGRTMSWYDPAVASKIRAIKELQRRQFLPLDLIRETLAKDVDASDELAAAEAIAKVLTRHAGKRSVTRADILERGGDPRELDWLAAAGLATPSGPDLRYQGDDLALLMTLGAARRAGLAPEMLPFEILGRYLVALRALVAVELEMFRVGVIRRAKPRDVARLTTAATRLSERLVVLLRRKLLLPTLHEMIEEDDRDPIPAPAVGSRVRRTRHRPRRKPGRRSER